jgi:acyl carrier protein
MDEVFTTVVSILTEVTAEDAAWGHAITPDSRLEEDLQLESMEYAALAERVQARYGQPVDLARYLRELDIDELIALTVGDLVGYVQLRAASR